MLELSKFSGLNVLDLAKKVTTEKIYTWNEGTHSLIDNSSQKIRSIIDDLLSNREL